MAKATPAQAKALREIAADARAAHTIPARTRDVLCRNKWVEIRKANGHEMWYVTAAGFRAIGRDDVAENLERALERAEAAKANGTLKAPGEVEYRA
ncbi:MAG TPA: hypothetical protein VFU47_03985, partial [Armatimonadota bacterium]|nr:hypothetical protein [Armatimonadota bacterium]